MEPVGPCLSGPQEISSLTYDPLTADPFLLYRVLHYSIPRVSPDRKNMVTPIEKGVFIGFYILVLSHVAYRVLEAKKFLVRRVFYVSYQ